MFYNRYESEENMDVNKDIVIMSEGYDRIDGRNAYHSNIKRLTLGMPIMEKNKNMQIAMQIWEEKEDGTLSIAMELPIHQIMDASSLEGFLLPTNSSFLGKTLYCLPLSTLLMENHKL